MDNLAFDLSLSNRQKEILIRVYRAKSAHKFVRTTAEAEAWFSTEVNQHRNNNIERLGQAPGITRVKASYSSYVLSNSRIEIHEKPNMMNWKISEATPKKRILPVSKEQSEAKARDLSSRPLKNQQGNHEPGIHCHEDSIQSPSSRSELFSVLKHHNKTQQQLQARDICMSKLFLRISTGQKLLAVCISRFRPLKLLEKPQKTSNHLGEKED